QRLAMIEWLSPLNFFIRQQDISRTRQPETGEWLLKDPKFKKWESGTGGVLWCSGIPGAGKTVLVSLVVDHLTNAQAKNPDIGVACIYFDHKETQVQTQENLLAALWRQLVFKQPLGPASDLYARLVEKKTKPMSKEMQKVLLHALQRFKQIYIIIDAIDEHPEKEWHGLAVILTKLSKNTNFLLTARPHVVPNMVFPQISSMEVQASTKDLEVYIKAQIEASPHLSQYVADNRGVETKIFSVLCNSVDGMFLLAKLHLEALDAAPNTKAFQHALETLPTDLYHTYENIFNRIECLHDTQKEIVQSALVWVANAKRPLTAMELCEAIAIELGTTTFNKDSITGIQKIISLCAGLIILDEQSSLVRLVHFTAQDYLDKVQHQTFPFAHVQITRSLFAYLNFKEFKCQYPLMNYCQYVLIHAQLCEEQLQDELIGFLKLPHTYKKKFGTMGWDCCPWNCYSWPDPHSSLWLAVAANLVHCVKVMTSQGFKLDVTTYPLHTAAHHGHKEMIALLLDQGIDVNARGGFYGNAVHAAAYSGDESIVQMLLDKGADMNAQGGPFETILKAAACGQHESIVQMLLDRGAEVNAQGGEYGTALQAAVCEGHENIVQMLLDGGANVNAQGGQYGTSLQAAAYLGHEIIVKMLLDKNAEINAEGGEYGTALQTAAYKKHETIVQMLLDRGADVNAQAGYYGTALQAAAYWGHETIVQVLLDSGAEVNAQGGYYGTVLQAAAYGGYETIVQMLLDRGADVNAQGGYYHTALQAAACEGYDIIVQQFLDEGADINAVGGLY
ncbi:ANK-REP-region domain-containing protein, partial [Favolaschia claudopus]